MELILRPMCEGKSCSLDLASNEKHPFLTVLALGAAKTEPPDLVLHQSTKEQPLGFKKIPVFPHTFCQKQWLLTFLAFFSLILLPQKKTVTLGETKSLKNGLRGTLDIKILEILPLSLLIWFQVIPASFHPWFYS